MDPSITTEQVPGTNVLTLKVDNPTDVAIPFTYQVDTLEEKIIEVKPKHYGEVSWTFNQFHTVNYGIFMEDHPEWSIPWQEFEFDPIQTVETVYPNVKIGK